MRSLPNVNLRQACKSTAAESNVYDRRAPHIVTRDRANTAVFSVANGVPLNPLPYPDPDSLISAIEVWGSPAAALGRHVRPDPNASGREVIGVADDVREDRVNHHTRRLRWPVEVRSLHALAAADDEQGNAHDQRADADDRRQCNAFVLPRLDVDRARIDDCLVTSPEDAAPEQHHDANDHEHETDDASSGHDFPSGRGITATRRPLRRRWSVASSCVTRQRIVRTQPRT